MTDQMTTVERVRVYAAVSPQVTVDQKTAQLLCTLADAGMKTRNLEDREARLQTKAEELLEYGERLKKAEAEFAFYAVPTLACLALGSLSALVGMFL